MISLLLALAAAQAAPTATAPARPAPAEIVAAAPATDWTAIAPEELLVMTLSPDAAGRPRRVVIQLVPAPFSQGWVANIRTLAKARWWDGTSVNRVQDNYVVQWGDATEKKPLPPGMRMMTEREYVHQRDAVATLIDPCGSDGASGRGPACDNYAPTAQLRRGWAIASDGAREWPVHCYGMVGVGRNLSPDTGSGAELYAVIGHAPRHLDRNIALVGRVIEGIEHLSSLPRGTGALGFYATPAERTPIASIRLASELPAGERPRFEYLSTESVSFGRYAQARANRSDAFFIRPAGGADVCNVPVPVRRVP